MRFLHFIIWLLAILAGSMTVQAELLAHWEFDETTGLTAHNSANSNLNHDGTLLNYGTDNSQWISGKFAGALSFNAINQKVDLVSNVVDIGDQWTIAAWFLAPLPNTGTRWHTLTRGRDGDHQIIANLNTNELGMFGNTGAAGGGFHGSGFDMDSLSSGWHHVTAVGVAGQSQTDYYIDGSYVGSASNKSTTDVMSIGNCLGGNCDQLFASAIDDLAIWDEALDPITIAGLGSASLRPTNALVPEPSTTITAIFALLSLILGQGIRK